MPSIPPLSISVLRRIQRIEREARVELTNCGLNGTEYLDRERALEILQSSVVSQVEIRLKFYETLPDFDRKWVGAILARAIESVLACFPARKYSIGSQSMPGLRMGHEEPSQFSELLDDVVIEHIRRRKQPTQSGLTAAESPVIEHSGITTIADPKALRDSYLTAFPDAKIRDICWAAQQHYREWRRWLKGEIKGGLKPDRAFRRVLTSGKSPESLVKKPRPPKWE